MSRLTLAETNVGGTLNICQAARDCGDVRIIQTSTSEVYGTTKYVPIDEGTRCNTITLQCSKIAADALAMSFYHSFGSSITLARPFNMDSTVS